MNSRHGVDVQYTFDPSRTSSYGILPAAGIKVQVQPCCTARAGWVSTSLWLSRASICSGRNRNPRGGDHYPIYWVTMIHLAFSFHQIEQLKVNLFPSCCDFSFSLVYPNFYFLRQESKTGCLFIYWRYIWRKLQTFGKASLEYKETKKSTL